MNERARRILEQARRNIQPIEFPPRPDLDPAAELRFTQPRTQDAPVKRSADDTTDTERLRVERQSWGRWLTDRLDHERSFILEAAGQAIVELLDKESARTRKELDDLRSQVSKLEVEIARSAAGIARLRVENAELAIDKGGDLPRWPRRELKAVN